jgi:hypothetical protein
VKVLAKVALGLVAALALALLPLILTLGILSFVFEFLPAVM